MDFFSTDQLAALSAGTVRVDAVLSFEFASGTVHAWNGNARLPVGEDTYLPLKGFAQIDGLGMPSGVVSEAVTVTLSGLPGQTPDILAVALAESSEVEQRLMTVSLLFFDEAWQPIGPPIALARGFMQPLRIGRSPMRGEEGGAQSITLTAENIFFGRARPPHGRYTDKDQQARSPGDLFFAFVAWLKHKTLRYPDF